MMRDSPQENNSNPSNIREPESNREAISKDGLQLLQKIIQDPKLTQDRRKAILSETLVRVNKRIGTPLVVAALNNLIQVVELIIKYDLVDLEQTCSIDFEDGTRAEGVTALWAAALSNHLDIVKLLVLNGADPNHLTSSNSSPLRTACFRGWKDVVLCLLNYGADVNIVNSQGSSCLMAAAYNGHRDIVTVLINRGAHLNFKDKKGNTALHYAAERGHLQVVKILIKLDAQVLLNNEGLSPLKLACNGCQDEVMKFFVLRPQITRYEIIEALELLGATYANHPEKCNINKAYKLLWTAMQHRYKDPDGDVLHKFVRPPVRAYGYRFECQTPEELAKIQDNPYAIHMEGLIVRERLLRTKNVSVPVHIRYRGACYADKGKFEDALELWKYAARLDQRNSINIFDQLFRIGKLMAQMIKQEQQVTFVHIEELFAMLLSDVEKISGEMENNKGNSKRAESRDRKNNSPTKEEIQKMLEQTQLITLIFLAVMLELELSRKEQRRCMKHIRRFIHFERELCQGRNTLLHLAVSKDTFRKDKELSSVIKLPSVEMTRVLIDAGGDANAKNQKGSTPLHVIASFTKEDPDSKRTSTSSAQIEIIEDLLMAGANKYAENKESLTPADYAQLEQIKTLISKFSSDPFAEGY
ncbi:protein fem-1 homolog B-like [Actinia tenebrosa]|uniref:Protein fem-1 homolog B n=1 Tax=Actinia tenebrosa TaxID=6105 RepID=A0A6P8HYD6_ACTTE|nr:protein fem-1 homolog B-like [Actinia tenebrosa]